MLVLYALLVGLADLSRPALSQEKPNADPFGAPKAANAKQADDALLASAFQLSAEAIRLAKETAKAELARRGDLKRRRPAGLKDLDSPEAIQRAIDQTMRELAVIETEEAARTKLEYLGPAAFDALVRGLKSDNERVRGLCADKLRYHGVRGIDALTAAIKSDPSAQVRSAAAVSLGQTYHPSVVPTLIEALHDPDASARHSAVFALEHLRDARAIEPLEESRERMKPNAHIVEGALRTIIGPLNEGPAFWPVELLKLRQLTINANTLASESFGKAEIDRLVAHIEFDNWGVLSACLYALRNLDARSSVPAIVKTKTSSSMFDALVEIGTTEAVDYVIECLQSKDPTLREFAISSLASAGRWAAPLLVDLLSDPTLAIRHEEGEELGLGLLSKWPDSHRAHSALLSCLSKAGLKGRWINLYQDPPPEDIQVEIKRALDWWKKHGAEFLRGADVPNPNLTSVYYIDP